MNSLSIYEIDTDYIDFLCINAPLVYPNKRPDQVNERKYIGIILQIHDMKYFAPLSSFKHKHIKMKESIDFIKIGTYAVINLNCMIPVPETLYKYIDFSNILDWSYRQLLYAEYRIIKQKETKILKNAQLLYTLVTQGKANDSLLKRCNDFLHMEDLCHSYEQLI